MDELKKLTDVLAKLIPAIEAVTSAPAPSASATKTRYEPKVGDVVRVIRKNSRCCGMTGRVEVVTYDGAAVKLDGPGHRHGVFLTDSLAFVSRDKAVSAPKLKVGDQVRVVSGGSSYRGAVGTVRGIEGEWVGVTLKHPVNELWTGESTLERLPEQPHEFKIGDRVHVSSSTSIYFGKTGQVMSVNATSATVAFDSPAGLFGTLNKNRLTFLGTAVNSPGQELPKGEPIPLAQKRDSAPFLDVPDLAQRAQESERLKLQDQLRRTGKHLKPALNAFQRAADTAADTDGHDVNEALNLVVKVMRSYRALAVRLNTIDASKE